MKTRQMSGTGMAEFSGTALARVVWSGARLRARACAVLVACALGVSVLMGAGPVLAGSDDGTPDTAFTTNTGTGFNGTVRAVAVQSDGKIIVGGSFATLNSTTVNRIARLNADGTPDTTFTTNIGTGFNNDVYAVAVQSDGKIIVGGCGVGGGRGEPNDQPHSNGGEDSFFQGDLTSL